MKNLILLLYCFLIAFLQLSQAQGNVITGKTTDQATSEPLPRSTIIVRGTTVDTPSLADGTYSLPVPASGTALVFNFVGYQTQEVVVTGYSVKRKRDIIGSVAVVNTREMLSIPSGNVINQLEGRVSDLTISSDASVNNAAKVRIREFGSFGRLNPLYIVDGILGNASNLNLNDIEYPYRYRKTVLLYLFMVNVRQTVLLFSQPHMG